MSLPKSDHPPNVTAIQTVTREQPGAVSFDSEVLKGLQRSFLFLQQARLNNFAFYSLFDMIQPMTKCASRSVRVHCALHNPVESVSFCPQRSTFRTLTLKTISKPHKHLQCEFHISKFELSTCDSQVVRVFVCGSHTME